MAEFFAMGGYGRYVWPAYGLAALVLIGILVASLVEARAATRRLKRLEEARDGERG